MTASSQNHAGERPPELTPVPPPMTDQVRAAYAAYGVALPAPAGSPALQPAAEQPQPVTTLQAAAAVMDAAMQKSDATGAELAEAERKAGILFDAEHVEAVRTAALEQARAEYEAALTDVHTQLTEVRRQLGTIAGSRRQVEAVLRLCEGRRGDDMLLVSAVAVAAEAATTALDAFPMTLVWNEEQGVQLPGVGASNQQGIVHCVSAYGGRADLVLTGQQRERLANLLGLQVRDIRAACATDGCGTLDDYDASDPALFGWSRLEVASLGDGPRWYCSDMCVFDALARAGHELAAEDQAAAVDPDEQGPRLPDHQVDETAVVDGQADEGAAGEAEAACARCGCTESRACKGGCHWVPNRQMVDLCSACATPEELAYAAGGLR